MSTHLYDCLSECLSDRLRLTDRNCTLYDRRQICKLKVMSDDPLHLCLTRQQRLCLGVFYLLWYLWMAPRTNWHRSDWINCYWLIFNVFASSLRFGSSKQIVNKRANTSIELAEKKNQKRKRHIRQVERPTRKVVSFFVFSVLNANRL